MYSTGCYHRNNTFYIFVLLYILFFTSCEHDVICSLGRTNIFSPSVVPALLSLMVFSFEL